MSRFENLYLVRLFRQNKGLFGLVLLFIFFQQYFYVKDNSTFPWFIWSMYSHDEYLPATVTQTEVFVDGERLDISSIPIWQEATVMHTFNKYMQLKNNNFMDPLDAVVKKRTASLPSGLQSYICQQVENNANAEKYPAWLKQYVENTIIKHPVGQIEFREVNYLYADYSFKKTDSSNTLLKIGH